MWGVLTRMSLSPTEIAPKLPALCTATGGPGICPWVYIDSMVMPVRILYVGEIVGASGVFCMKKLLPAIKQEHHVDFTIVGADGATGGYGTGKNHAVYLHKLGADVLAGGECIYYKRDMVPHIAKAPYILRPANYPPQNPGRGYHVYTSGNESVAVIVLLGQAGFDRVHLRNPFSYLPGIVDRIAEKTHTIILDFHASTSAEKSAMFFHADGMVSAVIGTHTKVMTADERIMPKGTAVITDVGRTGSSDSVGGLDPAIEIEKHLTQIPERSKASWKKLELQAVLIDIEPDGRASAIKRLRIPYTGDIDGSARDNS